MNFDLPLAKLRGKHALAYIVIKVSLYFCMFIFYVSYAS